MKLTSVIIKLFSARQRQKFTEKEHRNIRNAMAEAKDHLKTLPLSRRQRRIIGIHMEQMANKTQKLKPVSWLVLFTGSLSTLLLSLSVPHEVKKAIWVIVKYVFDKYMGGP